MSKFSPFYLASLVVFLEACTPLQPQVQAEPSVPLATVDEAAAVPELPQVTVTADLMYDLLVAELAGQQGDLRVASSRYLDAARVTRDPRVAKRATHMAIYNRDFATALQAARLWAEITPADTEALQSAAALFVRNNQIDEAVVYLKRLLEQTGEGPGLLIAATLLAREENHARALTVMRRLTAGYRDNPNALYAHAHLAHSLGDDEAAAEILDRLLKSYPDDRNGLLLRAAVQQQADQRDAAIATLQRAVRLYPGDAEMRLGLARLLLEARRLTEARDQFETLERLRPDSVDVLFALGLLAMEANDLSEARGYLKRVVDLGERREEALFALGQLEELSKDFDRAQQYYSAIEEGDDYLRARLRIAGILARRDGVDQAVTYLDGLDVTDAADRLTVLMAKAELLRDAGRAEESLAVYDRGLEEFADNSELLYARAMAAEGIGRIDLMERDLKAILAREPDHLQALNALGYTLADRTDRHQEAYVYIHRALELDPSDPAVLDSMGWVLYRLGRLPEAIDHLRRALEAQKDGEIAAHLGEVLWMNGQRDEALKVWDAATRFAPDHKALLRTRERFQP